MKVKYTWPAFCEEVEDGYSVFFPNFLGLESHGKTMEEIENNSNDALFYHIEFMEENRLKIPEPMSINNNYNKQYDNRRYKDYLQTPKIFVNFEINCHIYYSLHLIRRINETIP